MDSIPEFPEMKSRFFPEMESRFAEDFHLTEHAPERVDHAARAEQMLDYSHGRAEDIATAQVHATLALVEQQRTANLIAYMEAQARILETHPDHVSLDGLTRVSDAAWVGLGL